MKAKEALLLFLMGMLISTRSSVFGQDADVDAQFHALELRAKSSGVDVDALSSYVDKLADQQPSPEDRGQVFFRFIEILRRNTVKNKDQLNLYVSKALRASNKMTVHIDLDGADTGDGEAFDRRYIVGDSGAVAAGEAAAEAISRA